MLLHVHSERKDYKERGAQNGHLDFHTDPELCGGFEFKCCFTSAETVRTIWDGEPRTSTSTFTQLLSAECQCKYGA